LKISTICPNKSTIFAMSRKKYMKPRLISTFPSFQARYRHNGKRKNVLETFYVAHSRKTKSHFKLKWYRFG
jgi:uncharacterized membrane protein YesL